MLHIQPLHSISLVSSRAMLSRTVELSASRVTIRTPDWLLHQLLLPSFVRDVQNI